QVAVASPVLEVQAQVAGREEPLRIVGLDVFRAAQIQPALLAQAEDFADTLRADTVFLSPAARDWLEVEIGAMLPLQVGLREVRLRVAGWLPAEGTRARVAVMDIAGAQRLLERPDVLTRVDVKLRPGAAEAEARQAIVALLPPGVQVDRPDGAIEATSRMTRAYRINLNVLALVALFTGGLLVFSTQVLSVIRRRAQLALLRVLGITRRGLVGLLLLEGLTVGTLGAAAGLLLGYALATLVLRFIGADLGAGHFRGLSAAPAFEPLAVAVFFALGVGAAVLGSLLPALEAAHARPAAALKAGDDQHVFQRFGHAWPGLILLLLSAVLVGQPAIDGVPLFGYLAIGSLLLGSILLLPRVLALLLRWLPVPRSPAPALALAQLRNAPGPASMSLAAIVAAISLTVSMAIMVASFRESLDHWLVRVLPADLYLRAGTVGDSGFFSQADQARIAATDGVQRVEFLRSEQLLLDPRRAPVTLLARDLDPAMADQVLPLVAQAPVASDDTAPVWVSEMMVDVFGMQPGQRVELPIAGRSATFVIAGVWRDYARQNGALIVPRSIYRELSGDTRVSDAALWLADDADAPAVARSLRAVLPGGERLQMEQPAQIRARSLGIFDRTFAATYALEAAAILIGLFGLSSGVTAQALARRREFGVLRHVGMTRGQVAALLTSEGLLTSIVGLLAGLGLGWLISLVLIHVVNRQSFHWSMELHVPWLALLGFAAAMLALAMLTARASARHAQRDDAVRAVREDW
ncbi:MAG: FtsX-like permease family protein, partial [Burkholderiales bacterium]|nr:FtsX-like permease family protein [Burkholderiales bacterium]